MFPPNPINRFDLWARFLRDTDARKVAEIGVYRGEFARFMLENNPQIEQYFLIDPWRNIPTWNKPANTDAKEFERFYFESLSVTEFAAERRVVLRGKTTEVAGCIADESLDVVYVDGDHTLKGIAIDLISIFPKVKTGGWIIGDDFVDSIWQHEPNYEPSMIFPFAVYFAEAHQLTIHALPHHQFAMRKQTVRAPRGEGVGFRFVDHTGTYGDTSVLRHVKPRS